MPGDPALTAVRQCMRALLNGRYDDAERLARDAFHGARARSVLDPVRDLCTLGLARDRAHAEALEAFTSLGSARRHEVTPARCAMQAVALLELGRCGEAHRVLDRLAPGGFASLPRDGLWLSAIAHLAEAAAGVADTGSASSLYELLAPRRGTQIVVGPQLPFGGAADRCLGLLAMTLDREEAAASHFQVALALNARLDARPWLARTQVALGRLLLANGDPAARKRGLALLRLAAGAASELGMPAVAAEVEATLEDGAANGSLIGRAHAAVVDGGGEPG